MRINRILLYLSGSVLRITIFFGLSLVSFSLVFTNQTHVKHLIKDSGIYNNFVPAVIEDTISNQPDSSFPLQDKNIQAIINSSFSAKSLQTNVEHSIDGTYKWLEGKATAPEINIDFTTERQKTAEEISSYAFGRVRSLPSCFAVPETFDPFTVGCQPPLTNIDEEQQNFTNIIAGQQGILPKASYKTADLPKDISGQYIYERYSYAPKIYTWLTLAPYLVGCLLLASSIVLVYASKNKREGFQRLGIVVTTSGVALVMTPLIFSIILPSFTKSLAFSTPNNHKAQTLLNQTMNSITNDIYLLLINISIQVILFGIIILAIEKFTRPASRYSNAAKKSGLVSSHTKKPSSNRKFKPASVPVQSSEESTRRKPKRVYNKKYRKISKKEY